VKRYHDEQHIIERNHRARIRLVGTADGKFQQRGRYRKQDAYDCHHTRCFMCHSEKYGKDKGMKRRSQDLSFREQVKECA
jgi:hypothetical protein